MVESNAARKVPIQILPMTKSSFRVLGSSANATPFSFGVVAALSGSLSWSDTSPEVALPSSLASNGVVSEEGSLTVSSSVNAIASRKNVHMLIERGIYTMKTL